MPAETIAIEAIIQAPVEKVYSLYTQPKHITQWNFADESWCCPRASNDLRVGGKYLARMEAADGSMGFDFEGIYLQVIHEEVLHFEMPDQRQVWVRFKPINESPKGVKVSLNFHPHPDQPEEVQANGWNAILNRFKNYVEN